MQSKSIDYPIRFESFDVESWELQTTSLYGVGLGTVVLILVKASTQLVKVTDG